MVTIGGLWGVALLVGGALLLFLGLTFVFITRSAGGLSVLGRCPRTGYTTVVQHSPDERSYVTDVVSCRAFPSGQPITCGLPCLTGSARTYVTTGSVNLLRV
jgi:hypothetical protein